MTLNRRFWINEVNNEILLLHKRKKQRKQCNSGRGQERESLSMFSEEPPLKYSFNETYHTSECRVQSNDKPLLFPSKEQAAKVASTNIAIKFFRLQPEYLGTRRIRATVCNVPAFITGEVLAAFPGAYGCVEEINILRSAARTAYRNYTFRLCLTKESFQAIP